jgi:hypothetical protein
MLLTILAIIGFIVFLKLLKVTAKVIFFLGAPIVVLWVVFFVL